jgi:hypothetical protein
MSAHDLSSKTVHLVQYQMQRAYSLLADHAQENTVTLQKRELRRLADVCATIRDDMQDSPEYPNAMRDGEVAVLTLEKETWPEEVREIIARAVATMRADMGRERDARLGQP